MARWPEDDVDRACSRWAIDYVRNFCKPPATSAATVGPMGCTLGRVIERHDGAASSTERDRRWPEVFTGDALLVAIALQAMSELGRRMIRAHYVERWYTPTWVRQKAPTKQVVMARRLGLSLPSYYHLRDSSKSCIRVVLNLDSNALLYARGFLLHSRQAGQLPHGDGAASAPAEWTPSTSLETG